MLKNLSISSKISSVIALIVVLLTIGGTYTLSNYIGTQFLEREITKLNSQTDSVLDMIKNFDSVSRTNSVPILKLFTTYFSGEWKYDSQEKLSLGDKTVPLLTNGGINILSRTNEVDDFSKRVEGAVATVFVKTPDNDFVRITTSLKKENGERAISTSLGKNHPAYEKVSRGENYTGIAKLFGKYYYTQYQPIKVSGKIAGILFVGIDIDKDFLLLKESIQHVKIGKTGYVYVLDTREATRGDLIVHPKLEGKNILDTKDSQGKDLTKEILANKTGIIYYDWKNPGEDSARKKVVDYREYEPWSWIVGASTYLDELEEQKNAITLFIVMINLVVAIIIVTISFFLVRKLLSPVRAITQTMHELSQGNLLVSIPSVDSNDEVGKLSQATSVMVESLKRMLSELRQSSQFILNASHDMTLASKEITTRSNQQNEALMNVAATTQEVAVSIDQVAQSANETDAVARNSKHLTEQGLQVVDRATARMGGVVQKINQSMDMVSQLAITSQDITSIVNVIHEIADQTNLLALNAAIEAARAGETGRGFAVVADEVRKLAERTNLSTRDISLKISTMQDRVGTTSQTMSESNDQIVSAVEVVNQTKDSLGHIDVGTARTESQVSTIAMATKEQSVAVNDIARNIEHVSSLTEENTRAIEHVEQCAVGLEVQANQLQKLISQFKM